MFNDGKFPFLNQISFFFKLKDSAQRPPQLSVLGFFLEILT
jgi:hypothetical protein